MLWHAVSFVVVCGFFTAAHGLLSLAVCGFSSCGPWGSCPVTCGNLVPQLEIKSMSAALEDGFLTTGPPGKS